MTNKQLTPREIQERIAADPEASKRILAHLDAEGVAHSGQISGATLAAACGVDSRTWRRWVGGEREMPETARRLLSYMLEVPPQVVRRTSPMPVVHLRELCLALRAKSRASGD